jgi:hypothetical protein
MTLMAELSSGDKIALVSLVFTVITTVCVLLLAYAALAQTARPNVKVRLRSARRVHCGEEAKYVFELVNRGHWYGSPMAVDITVYCDFPPEFELREMRYGSVQEHETTEVKNGKRGMRYLKAKGIKLSKHEHGEEVHVVARSPQRTGVYRIRVSGHSANDASFAADFDIDCHGVTDGGPLVP